MPTPDPTLDALIVLLEDQDELVFSSVREKLLSLGSSVLPRLEDALHSATSFEHFRKLEELISHFKRELIIDEVKRWMQNENRTLLEGWLLISSIHHPGIARDKVENNVHKIYRDAWLEISETMTSLEKVAVINHILFKINNFSIRDADVVTPDTVILDKLLFSKSGNVYSLTILYLIIARFLNLDLVPIMLANKLLLVYEDNISASIAYGSGSEKYLFYVNVAHRGSIISPKEVQFLYDKSHKYGKMVTRIESDISLIKKLLSMMYLMYTGDGDQERLNITEDILALMENY